MAVRPSDIVKIPQGGNGNMGDVTDRTSPARFTLDVDLWLLVYARITTERIQGTPGTDVDDLTFKLDASLNGQHNHTLRKVTDVGPTGEKPSYILRVPEDEQQQWVFSRGQILVLEWPNPDAGNIRWAVDIGLADAARA